MPIFTASDGIHAKSANNNVKKQSEHAPSKPRLNLYRSSNQSNSTANSIRDTRIEIHESPTKGAKFSNIGRNKSSISSSSNQSVLMNQRYIWSICVMTAIALPLLTWLIIHLTTSNEASNNKPDKIELDDRFSHIKELQKQIAASNNTEEKLKLYEQLGKIYDQTIVGLSDIDQKKQQSSNNKTPASKTTDKTPAPKTAEKTPKAETSQTGTSSGPNQAQVGIRQRGVVQVVHDTSNNEQELNECKANLNKWKKKSSQCTNKLRRQSCDQ